MKIQDLAKKLAKTRKNEVVLCLKLGNTIIVRDIEFRLVSSIEKEYAVSFKKLKNKKKLLVLEGVIALDAEIENSEQPPEWWLQKLEEKEPVIIKKNGKKQKRK